MKSRKLYVVAAVCAFIAAILFFIDKNYSLGTLWVAMALLFLSFYSRK